MIQYLKIRNFGPIKDEVELSFEATLGEELSDDIYTYLMPDGCRLLKLAYIYGANASGKTTILKVFEFLKELILKPLPDKSSAFDYQPFLFCADPDQNESFIELAFYTNKVRHIYTVTFNKEAVLNEKLVYFHTAKPTELFSRSQRPRPFGKQHLTYQHGSWGFHKNQCRYYGSRGAEPLV
jgi:AAA15 family ATPase/GTPase